MQFKTLLIFFLKKQKGSEIKGDGSFNSKIQEITRTVEELSDEQRDILKQFKSKMELFTTERTLESCIEALNLSLQLANTREKLLEAYKQYSYLLEQELKNTLRDRDKENNG
jgi:uncharacterized membrane protein YccC